MFNVQSPVKDYDIKTRRFLVSVPTIHLKTEEELDREGVYITGNKNVDRDILSRKSNVLIPIIDLAKFHEKGVPIITVYPQDKETIYRAIEMYINNWINYMENSSRLNIVKFPEDELIMLDNLAKGIFNHNKSLMREINIKDKILFGEDAITTENMFAPSSIVDSFRDEPTRNSFDQYLEDNIKLLANSRGLNR